MENVHARGLTYGIAIGAGLMFLFDPRGGGARRAIARQKGVRAVHEVETAVGIGARDLRHRAHGMAARAFSKPSNGVVGQKLVARVRTKLGRVSAHPHSIEVLSIADGKIELKGPILAEEHDRVVAAIARVPGVHEVADALEVHATADVTALQGGALRDDPVDRLWTPATRLVLGAAAAGVSVVSLVKGQPLGLLAGGTVALALARSIAHRGARHPISKARGGKIAREVTRPNGGEEARAG